MVDELSRVSANALIPDQLIPYVSAVSGLESRLCGPGLLHHADGQGVLVIYPPKNTQDQETIDEAVREALAFPALKRLTVIASHKPAQAPATAASQSDWYWSVAPSDCQPTGKLANMLRRAAREADITRDTGGSAWTEEHMALTTAFCSRKASMLDAGSIYLFNHLQAYLLGAPDAMLFSARAKSDGRLIGLAIGDYTAFATAFYMFAFRAENAVPGLADLLLGEVIQEGSRRGHVTVNLGLGINAGVEFFKKKWGAKKFLPYVETSWDLPEPGRKNWLGRLFGRN